MVTHSRDMLHLILMGLMYIDLEDRLDIKQFGPLAQ